MTEICVEVQLFILQPWASANILYLFSYLSSLNYY